MLSNSALTSFKKVYDSFFETDIDEKEASFLALSALDQLKHVMKPVPVEDRVALHRFSLSSREDVQQTQNNI